MTDEQFLDWCSQQQKLTEDEITRLTKIEMQFDAKVAHYGLKEIQLTNACLLAKPENIPYYVEHLRNLIRRAVQRQLTR